MYFNDYLLLHKIFYLKSLSRDHWKGEVSADEWVPVFPVFLLAIGIMKKSLSLKKKPILAGTDS